MRTWWDEQPKRLLAVVVLVDLVLIVLHVVTGGDRGPITSLDTDTGLGGLWGFGTALAAAGLVHRVFRRTGIAVYLAWALTFVVVGLDDVAEIHENLGDRLARTVDLPAVAGLRSADMGELVVWAMLGAPLLVAIGVTVRHADARGRRDSMAFFLVMALLVAVAAGMDALHSMTSEGVQDMWEVTPVGVVEDGGELLVLSMVLSTAFAAHRQRNPTYGELIDAG